MCECIYRLEFLDFSLGDKWLLHLAMCSFYIVHIRYRMHDPVECCLWADLQQVNYSSACSICIDSHIGEGLIRLEIYDYEC